MEKVNFQIELDNVLEILSSKIYDSPYAMLRENIQNAYDAILMRESYSDGIWSSINDGLIKIELNRDKVIVTDNGIGMTRDVLKNNYWKAGSSGKKTELAKKSGVIGTFGIGGMANFGVCSKISIETESIESKERLISEVERKNISLSEKNIIINPLPSKGTFGTSITIDIDQNHLLDITPSKTYLLQFIQYLPIKVEFNSEIISQNSVKEKYKEDAPRIIKNYEAYKFSGVEADITIQSDYNGKISAFVNKIKILGDEISGEAYLKQDSGPLWGFRSFFGLSPVAISTYYSFGGIVNLSLLQPTAGREALSRESVDLILKIINLVEECATITLSNSEICTRSNPFMNYILQNNKIELAGKLQPRIEPAQNVPEINLEKIKEISESSVKVFYFDGVDETLIKSIATPDKILVVLSRSNPRRQIEQRYIEKYCKAEKIVDKPQLLKMYSREEYEMDEIALVIYIENILKKDYAIQTPIINIGELTHNMALLVNSPILGTVEIILQRRHSSLVPVLEIFHNSREIFEGFVIDYVRSYIYPQIRSWVPSSTKDSADALQKILKTRKELFQISYDDMGLASLFSDVLAGKKTLGEAIIKFNTIKNIQTQEIVSNNIGKLESEIPDLAENPVKPPEIYSTLPQPSPSILRTEVMTEKKLLILEKESSFLNSFNIFLAISDRAFKEEYYFFMAPHTTRIIWGGQRIIFIFTHASNNFSLYYDIELFEDVGGVAGGAIYPTTTIITKNKIFIPVPNILRKYFEVTLEKPERKFYVRYDNI